MSAVASRNSFLFSQARNFAVILSTGEKVERELTPVERELVSVRETQFSKLGLYSKKTTNETTLFRLFQLAKPKQKSDYSACMYAVNTFYNFGVQINHFDFTNRWIATAVETGRVDEAVEIVKFWHTWLSCPPRIELVEVLIGMVNIGQSREMLKAIREHWQMPLSPYAYTTVIAKELSRWETDDTAVLEAFVVWKDADDMGVVLPVEINEALVEKLRKTNLIDKADYVDSKTTMQSYFR